MSSPQGTEAPDAQEPKLFSLPAPYALLITGVVCYGFLVAVPLTSGIPDWVATFGGSLLFACLSMSLVAAGTLWRTQPHEEMLLAAAFLVAWVLLDKLAGSHEMLRLYLGPASNVLFLLSCLFVGKVLAHIVRERAMALPVAIVAAVADIFTVFWGPTGQALEKAPKLVAKLSLAIPQAGSAAGPAGAKGLAHVATIGLGDFIFLALFMCLAVRFGLRVVPTFWAMLVGACVGIAIALGNPFGLAGMPLLPYMSAGFLAVNFHDFHLTLQERRDLMIALVILGVLFAVVAVALRL